MARRTSLADSLTPAPRPTTAPATEPATDAPAAADPASRPARKRATRKAPETAAQTPAEAPAAASQDDVPVDAPAARTAPKVLTAASTGEAKRVGLYLHPDDFRALALARLDDGVDANARLRAMIALWRHDDRVRARVDRLARTVPRGPRGAS